MAEQAPHAEYPQLPVSPEQLPHVQADHAFAAHDEPFHEYPASQEFEEFDSAPLSDTVPSEQENVCWYVRVPLATGTATVGFAVAPWARAATEYERPFTVLTVAEHAAAAVREAVQEGESVHPYDPSQVHVALLHAAGNAGDDDGFQDAQYVSEPYEEEAKEYVFAAVQQEPSTEGLHCDETESHPYPDAHR